MQLRLNSYENTKRSYARIIREYAQDRMEERKARTLGYLLSNYLAYWKFEIDRDMEAEIREILERERQRNG
jgi:hypothetical protein